MDDEEDATTQDRPDAAIVMDALVLFDQIDTRDYPDHYQLGIHSIRFLPSQETLQLLRKRAKGQDGGLVAHHLHLIRYLSLWNLKNKLKNSVEDNVV